MERALSHKQPIEVSSIQSSPDRPPDCVRHRWVIWHVYEGSDRNVEVYVIPNDVRPTFTHPRLSHPPQAAQKHITLMSFYFVANLPFVYNTTSSYTRLAVSVSPFIISYFIIVIMKNMFSTSAPPAAIASHPHFRSRLTFSGILMC